MGCIAVWCSSVHDNKDDKHDTIYKLEVHFNLWRVRKKPVGTEDFLDIGIMVPPENNADFVQIFVPAKINQNNVSDLGHCFKEDINLVGLLFNETWSPLAGEKILEVQDSGKNHLFDIYIIDKDSDDIDVSPEAALGGSIISISIPAELKGKKHYYRIRLDQSCIKTLHRIYRPLNKPFESAFISTEVIDFRLNEHRSLNSIKPSLTQRIHACGRTLFTKTHFFLMREAHEDFEFSHKPPNSSRTIEIDSWKVYIGINHLFDQIIAYDWKDEKVHHTFTAFAKFKSFFSNLTTIIVFIVGVLILGILSNWLSSLLFPVE